MKKEDIGIRIVLGRGEESANIYTTDFSTAEIDDQQVALDRFSLFFPEKRDFFLQDAGIFEFGNLDRITSYNVCYTKLLREVCRPALPSHHDQACQRGRTGMCAR